LKDAALEREGIEAQQQIAESNEKAEEAKNNAAQAIERAAQTQLEAEQLKAQLAWRALTSADFDKLVAALSPHPHWGVVIGYVANDPESTAFALQLHQAFWKAGWSPPCHAYQYSGALNWGVFVPDTDGASDAVSAIRSAFASINLPFGTANPAPPSAWMDSRSNLQLGPDTSAMPGCAYLIIGSKPPPL